MNLGLLAGSLHHPGAISRSSSCTALAKRAARSNSRGSGRNLVCQAEYGCRLVGVGSSAPDTVLSNSDLGKIVDTDDEWISTRTGIRRRHVLGEGESLTHHAATSAQNALDMAGVSASDIELILMATSSPDDVFGGACQVQAMLGSKAAAFDITAACSGFVVSLVTATQFIRSGMYKNVLVVGADALSRFIDWNDRGTCILFGDASGAVVMQAANSPCSLLAMDINSDGHGHKSLNAPFSSNGCKPQVQHSRSTPGTFENMYMNGKEVFKFAVRSVPETLERSLSKAGLEKSDIDWLVMHQANQRILDSTADRLGVPHDRVLSNIAEYGNTSAASIPLVLDQAVREGKVSNGDTLALAGFGAGLTWASAIYKWG